MNELNSQGLTPTFESPNVRDALLPKLLSGEIRVAEVERLVEEAT